MQRADDVDADDVLDALVQRDIHDVKPGTHERGETEDIYERMILARAYERAAAKRYDDARADFDSVAEQTGSFEAVVGAIDMLLKKGESPAAIEARYARGGARGGIPPARAGFRAGGVPRRGGRPARCSRARPVAAGRGRSARWRRSTRVVGSP